MTLDSISKFLKKITTTKQTTYKPPGLFEGRRYVASERVILPKTHKDQKKLTSKVNKGMGTPLSIKIFLAFTFSAFHGKVTSF